jgi:hypothetical protein
MNPNKEDAHTEQEGAHVFTDDFFHVVWLARLSSDKLDIVEQFLKDLRDTKYWEGVNDHKVRGILKMWANRIEYTE